MTTTVSQSTIGKLFLNLGDQVEDSDEETFTLFSHDFPSQNLGFVDPRATSIEVEVRSRAFSITQSPGLLASNREAGSTGAVLWKITPSLASWLASSSNVLRQYGILDTRTTAVELGCGISGLIGLTLAPDIEKYVLTDQAYVLKTLQTNLQANRSVFHSQQRARNKASNLGSDPVFNSLDWEKDSVQTLSQILGSCYHDIDLLIACDCIYNEYLIDSFVETCADICSLASTAEGETTKLTLLLVAQQLRSPDVFQSWLDACLQRFDIWRIPDCFLGDDLKQGTGNVVHLGILKGQIQGLLH